MTYAIIAYALSLFLWIIYLLALGRRLRAAHDRR
jgi:hypothetical protein